MLIKNLSVVSVAAVLVVQAVFPLSILAIVYVTSRMAAHRTSLDTLAMLGPSIAVFGTKVWNLESVCDILEMHFARCMMSSAQKEMLGCLCRSVFQHSGFSGAVSFWNKAFLRKVRANCWSKQCSCAEQAQSFGETVAEEQKSKYSREELVNFIVEKIVYITSQIQRTKNGRRAEPRHTLQDVHGNYIRTSVLSCCCSVHDTAGCNCYRSSAAGCNFFRNCKSEKKKTQKSSESESLSVHKGCSPETAQEFKVEFAKEPMTAHALYRHYHGIIADVYALSRRRRSFVYIRTYLKDDHAAGITDTRYNYTVLLLLQLNYGKQLPSKSFFERTVPENTLAYFSFMPGKDYLVYRKSSTFYVILPLNERSEELTYEAWPHHTGYRLVDVFYFGMDLLQRQSTTEENKDSAPQKDNLLKTFATEESPLDKLEAVCGIELRNTYSHRMLFVAGDSMHVEFVQLS